MGENVNSLAPGRGVEWLSEGWGLFKKAPGLWIGMLVTLFVIAIVLRYIPFIGGIAFGLMSPIFVAGLCMGAQASDRGEELKFEHLFAAFKGDRVVPLVILAVVQTVVWIVFAVVVFFTIFTMLMGGAAAGGESGGGMGAALGGLIALALAIPVLMLFYFAVPLIALARVEPVDSMKRSFNACIANFVPLLIWGLIAFVLVILAAIPFGLGLIVLFPILTCSYYCMYRDIFTSGAAPAKTV